jgi:hypothetical protein
MKPGRDFLIALAGLPLTLPILAWWGFCLVMAALTGEFDRPISTPAAR